MKLACLFSGGKDSNYALFKASKFHKIKCLITMISQNKDSYMFQSPGINFAKIQAKCLEIPIIEFKTKGEKEKELVDLKSAIKYAKEKYKIEGIATGAIKSTYQASRIQKICSELNLWCLNPIWQINEKEYLKELLKHKFEIKIIAIASYPLDKRYIGKTLDKKLIENFSNLKSPISIIGEGGEFETFVTNSPMFKKKLKIKKNKILMDSENSGKLIIEKLVVNNK